MWKTDLPTYEAVAEIGLKNYLQSDLPRYYCSNGKLSVYKKYIPI